MCYKVLETFYEDTYLTGASRVILQSVVHFITK
jgi:hypothetical protein